MKKGTLKDIATSFTTIIFFIISITGVMLYFHFFSSQVKSLHEILGLAFVATALFHVIMNWKSMQKYFSKKIFVSAIVICLAVSSVFVYDNLQSKGNPKGYVLKQVVNAPLEDSLKVLNIDKEQAFTKLKKAGLSISDEKSIRTIAQSNLRSPFEIIAIVTQ